MSMGPSRAHGPTEAHGPPTVHGPRGHCTPCPPSRWPCQAVNSLWCPSLTKDLQTEPQKVLWTYLRWCGYMQTQSAWSHERTNESSKKYSLLTLNRLRVVWSKGYQRGSPGKSHQNGDYTQNKQWHKVVFPPVALRPDSTQTTEY